MTVAATGCPGLREATSAGPTVPFTSQLVGEMTTIWALAAAEPDEPNTPAAEAPPDDPEPTCEPTVRLTDATVPAMGVVSLA